MKRNVTQLGRTLRMEWLEPRILLAANAAMAGSVLPLDGTTNKDAIEVREAGIWHSSSLSVSIKNNMHILNFQSGRPSFEF